MVASETGMGLEKGGWCGGKGKWVGSEEKGLEGVLSNGAP